MADEVHGHAMLLGCRVCVCEASERGRWATCSGGVVPSGVETSRDGAKGIYKFGLWVVVFRVMLFADVVVRKIVYW